MSSISAYSQLQSWHAAQKAVTNYIYGSPSSGGSAVDFSSAFTDIAGGFYTSIGNLSGQAALARVQTQVHAAVADQNNISLTAGADFAKAAGNAVLAQLGWMGSGGAPSSSGSYTAPINAATGYSYVQTSAANIGALNALNLFA